MVAKAAVKIHPRAAGKPEAGGALPAYRFVLITATPPLLRVDNAERFC